MHLQFQIKPSITIVLDNNRIVLKPYNIFKKRICNGRKHEDEAPALIYIMHPNDKNLYLCNDIICDSAESPLC